MKLLSEIRRELKSQIEEIERAVRYDFERTVMIASVAIWSGILIGFVSPQLWSLWISR